jgi:hypothetical protein
LIIDTAFGCLAVSAGSLFAFVELVVGEVTNGVRNLYV